MAILINQFTRVIVQGITGKEGSRAALEMMRYGTAVVAGVRPGKAGERIHEVPVYDTVRDAMVAHPEVSASLITVPAAAVADAAAEAIAAGISLVVILTEHVPTFASAQIVARATAASVRVVGPSSVGIISPGVGKIGAIGSSEVASVFAPGRIGVISKSGGMTAEIAAVLARAGFGVSTALGIGGDTIIGTDFADALRLFAADAVTDAVVCFGEIGGAYEEDAAAYVATGAFSKPVIAMVAGRFTDTLAPDTVLGHAGAVVQRGRGSYASKIAAWRAAGCAIADRLEEIPILLRKAMYARSQSSIELATIRR